MKLSEQSQVRAGGDGFIVQLLAKDGEMVAKGAPLFELEDPLLPSQVAVLEWNLKELKVRQTVEFMQDRTQVGIYQDEMNRVEAQLVELRSQMAKQIVRSSVAGIFVVSQHGDTQGRFVHKGELLAYVADVDNVTARVVIPQQAVDQVRNDTESVDVRFGHQPGESISASIQQEVPLITDQLPSRALGSQGGGAIVVDARDSRGLKTLEQIYQLDIVLPPKRADVHIGSKVYVRFNHHAEPLAQQWYRSLSQLFLTRFEL